MSQKSGVTEKINELKGYICMHANCSSINVPTVTPNYMAYGELGRNPLFIEAAAKCMQYWFRVLKQPATRHSKMEYQSLLIVSEKDESCVAHIQSLLCRFDYGFVWLFGGVGDEKSFLGDFRERLRRNFTPDWFSHLSQSSCFEMYHCFKSVIGREEHLDLIKVDIYRTALARFRLWVSPFNAHRLCCSLSRDVLDFFAPIKLKTKCSLAALGKYLFLAADASERVESVVHPV